MTEVNSPLYLVTYNNTNFSFFYSYKICFSIFLVFYLCQIQLSLIHILKFSIASKSLVCPHREKGVEVKD